MKIVLICIYTFYCYIPARNLIQLVKDKTLLLMNKYEEYGIRQMKPDATILSNKNYQIAILNEITERDLKTMRAAGKCK